MSNPLASFADNWRRDFPASIVVFLVALPLCLGIALASGAPLFSGLIAGIVGGIVVGILSKSPLSVSGPAAGLTVIVLTAIESVPTYQAFLLAVVLAGIMQIAFSFTKGGVLGEFVPTSVTTGMLAAIGLILILKQIPHALGYDGDVEGDFAFLQSDGMNTMSTIWYTIQNSIQWGAAIVALISLIFLFWWDANKPKDGMLRLLPGPLVVVAFAVIANAVFAAAAPGLVIEESHLVQVPVAGSIAEFTSFFSYPDFSAITLPAVWSAAITLALVASLESLLSVKAIDTIDPERRTTDKNRELLAQGSGNLVSGLIGGLPVTSVIVRSSANTDANAASKASTIMHGFWLLLSVLLIPTIINLIPLSVLAAILIQTGYKLNKPALYAKFWKLGWAQFIPFLATVAAILFTDLLKGIAIGLVIGFVFVIARNFRPAVTYVEDSHGNVLVRARRNLYFIHKYELQKAFNRVPDGANVIIDLTATDFVDPDNIDIINGFSEGARFRNIDLFVRGDIPRKAAALIKAEPKDVVYA